MMKLVSQIFKFGIVGIICFIIDYGFMILLTEFFDVPYLISCAISFCISVTVNYLLSMRYVFLAKRSMNKHIAFIIFILLSIIGLGLTELLMWIFVENWHLNYMISKIFVTGIVMIYNFLTKKITLEDNNEN